MGPNEQLLQFILSNPFILIAFIAWTFTWKGISLWMSARRGQRNWFIALLLLNTLGVLEIGYILYTKNKEKKNIENTEDSEQ